MFWLFTIALAGSLDWGDEEIVVVGEDDVQRARRALVDKLESLGFTASRRDGQTVFKPPANWMGKFFLDDEGWVRYCAFRALRHMGAKAPFCDWIFGEANARAEASKALRAWAAR